MGASKRAQPDDAVRTALAYHQRTKHAPGRYARSLGYLDWATQPDPFRRFEGAPVLALDPVEPSDEPDFYGVLRSRVTAPAPLGRHFVSQLFFDSLALSAWKQHGTARWSLRVNPSSGNLHPTEGYLIAPAIEGLAPEPGVYHYAPYMHALERRLTLGPGEHAALSEGLPPDSLLVVLTSIHWRESWKYGERAFRYCQHDVGHALAALAIAAGIQGWDARLLEGASDADAADLAGIRGQTGPEAERADALVALVPRGSGSSALRRWRPASAAVARVAAGQWLGTPRALSSDHQEWPVIDEVAQATQKLEPARFAPVELGPAPEIGSDRSAPARSVVRQRRSALAMDGESRLSRAAFSRMLAATLPGANSVPFAALPWSPRVHLALFVHRVDDVDPGLYLLTREAEALARLRNVLRSDFAWEPVELGRSGLELRLLVPTDVRRAAELASCHQDIAADGAFAVAMLAELEPALNEQGAFMYSRLHWEAGAVGQALYLAAEVEGLRATGIGCYFDDLVHELLGVRDARVQDLYHFTVGGALDDPRLVTTPAYAHLERDAWPEGRLLAGSGRIRSGGSMKPR